MEKKPCLSGALLAAHDTHGSLASSFLVECASKNIRANPKLLLEEGAELARLSLARMEEILQDEVLGRIYTVYNSCNEFTHKKVQAGWTPRTVEQDDCGLNPFVLNGDEYQ
jgi:hypothetical protein